MTGFISGAMASNEAMAFSVSGETGLAGRQAVILGHRVIAEIAFLQEEIGKGRSPGSGRRR